MSEPTVAVFLAPGCEEIEALTVVDILFRAKIACDTVSVAEGREVTSSHGVTMVATKHVLEADLDAYDMLVLPGGLPGTPNLHACEPLMEAMKAHYAAGGTVAAICAAPGLVLGQLPNLSGIEFTCFEGFETLPESKGARFVPKAAIRSGRIITGRSAGHALTFALEILGVLRPDRVEEVKHALYLWTA